MKSENVKLGGYVEPVAGTPRQVEEKFGIKRSRLAKKRCLGGGPPFYRVANSIFYKFADVEQWLEAGGRQSSTADMTPAQRGKRYEHVVGDAHWKRSQK